MKNSKNRGGFTQVKAIFFSYKQTCTDRYTMKTRKSTLKNIVSGCVVV